MYLSKYLFIILFIFAATQSEADEICFEAFQIYDIGFVLSRDVLRANQYHPGYAKGKTREEIIAAIYRRMGQLSHKPKAVSSAKNLAKEIVLAAEAWGVDPFIFAGVIDNETNYGASIYNKTGGDSGYTQMTSSGLNELRDQYLHKKNGPILMAMARQYFKSSSPDSFYRWVTAEVTTAKKKELLTNTAYSLAAGASLLKIYHSVPVVVAPYSNYSYEPHGYAYTLALYNANRSVKPGDKYPHYMLYSRKARKNAAKARDASMRTCGVTQESESDNSFAMDIIMGACELHGDKGACERALEYEFLPNSDDSVSI